MKRVTNWLGAGAVVPTFPSPDTEGESETHEEFMVQVCRRVRYAALKG